MQTDGTAGRPADKPNGTTRERVAALMERGLTRNQIGAALGISSQAVHYHITRIRKDAGGKPAA